MYGCFFFNFFITDQLWNVQSEATLEASLFTIISPPTNDITVAFIRKLETTMLEG